MSKRGEIPETRSTQQSTQHENKSLTDVDECKRYIAANMELIQDEVIGKMILKSLNMYIQDETKSVEEAVTNG